MYDRLPIGTDPGNLPIPCIHPCRSRVSLFWGEAHGHGDNEGYKKNTTKLILLAVEWMLTGTDLDNCLVCKRMKVHDSVI